MKDVLAANAEKTEQQARPTAESLRAARDAGAFALRADATALARQLTEMGRGCPATAWIAGTNQTAKTLVADSDLDEATRTELLIDPGTLFCGSGQPTGSGERGPEGVRLTGRWANVSGCEDASWAVLGAMVDGAYSLVVVPTADLSVEPTWNMAGMRGTGSHTVVADDVVVPERLVGTLQLPAAPRTMLVFGLTVLAPVVGGALGALDVVNGFFASDRKPYMTSYASMRESPGARQWLVEATTAVRRAERTMLSVAAAIDAETEIGAEDDSRLHLDLCEAARDCRSAVEWMLDLHGASGFGALHPLQRFWRDVAVGSRHPHLREYLAVEGYARTLVG